MAMAFSLMPEPLTEEQKELLESQIQSMIDLTFATLNEAKAFSAGAISLTFGEDGNELIKIDAENWTVIEGELKRLGEELDKAVLTTCLRMTQLLSRRRLLLSIKPS